jgi:hypothetical protein
MFNAYFIRSPQIPVNFGIWGFGGSFATMGSPLYSGPEAAPTFLLGTFALSDGYNLVIANTEAAVPELDAWILMLFGLGAIGFDMRRRQNDRLVSNALSY